MRPGSEASRRHWATRLREAATPQGVGELLVTYARLLPRTAFKKGFHKWWLSDGGKEEESRAEKEKANKELRRVSGGDKDAKGKDGGKLEQPTKELPPAQAETAHQVLLRLRLLDHGLAYG